MSNFNFLICSFKIFYEVSHSLTLNFLGENGFFREIPDSDEFKNTISRENAWNSQYSNIQNYANQMTASLTKIEKQTKPLQYTQERNVYNSK